ncbi:MAG: hypothetical protein ACRDKW_18285 [Actinomycetota bacterium]
MSRYSVAGRSADTAATANHVAAQLWNPSAIKALEVVEILVVQVGATVSNHSLQRSTARGTAGSTVTPDIDNDYSRALAPPSGVLLDLAAFSVQPTLAGPDAFRANAPAAAGVGFGWSFYSKPYEVPPGTGVCILTPVAVILQDSDFTFVFDD